MKDFDDIALLAEQNAGSRSVSIRKTEGLFVATVETVDGVVAARLSAQELPALLQQIQQLPKSEGADFSADVSARTAGTGFGLESVVAGECYTCCKQGCETCGFTTELFEFPLTFCYLDGKSATVWVGPNTPVFEGLAGDFYVQTVPPGRMWGYGAGLLRGYGSVVGMGFAVTEDEARARFIAELAEAVLHCSPGAYTLDRHGRLVGATLNEIPVLDVSEALDVLEGVEDITDTSLLIELKSMFAGAGWTVCLEDDDSVYPLASAVELSDTLSLAAFNAKTFAGEE